MENVLEEILGNKDNDSDLDEWFRISGEIARLRTQEALLRSRIFKKHFPDPHEGTNKVVIGYGCNLIATHKINRGIDRAAYDTLRDELNNHNIPTGELVKWKPELSVSHYRKLNDSQRKEFDRILIIKEGTPSLKIVQTK